MDVKQDADATRAGRVHFLLEFAAEKSMEAVRLLAKGDVDGAASLAHEAEQHCRLAKNFLDRILET
jgi:hypothetical protein